MLKRKVYLIVGAKYSSWGRLEGLNLPRIASAKNNKPPATKQGEVAIELNIELPEALFKKPSYSATIAVPEGAASSKISADVISNIEQLVNEATGLTLTIDALEDKDA